MVKNKAPATLCSWGIETFAINNVPVEKTKSAPITDITDAGNEKAQYDARGLINAKRRQAPEVAPVPTAANVRGKMWNAVYDGRLPLR